VLPDITLTYRTQQCIADCMNQHITIRVRHQAVIMCYVHSTKHQRVAISEAVGIVTMAYTH
jgi:hypothetical protein